jgi:hypothetical protein
MGESFALIQQAKQGIIQIFIFLSSGKRKIFKPEKINNRSRVKGHIDEQMSIQLSGPETKESSRDSI